MESNSELLRLTNALSDLLAGQSEDLKERLDSITDKLDFILKDLARTQMLNDKDRADLSKRLSTLVSLVRSMGKEEKVRFSQLAFDTKEQNELLRLLVANSLIDYLPESHDSQYSYPWSGR